MMQNIFIWEIGWENVACYCIQNDHELHKYIFIQASENKIVG